LGSLEDPKNPFFIEKRGKTNGTDLVIGTSGRPDQSYLQTQGALAACFMRLHKPYAIHIRDQRKQWRRSYT